MNIDCHFIAWNEAETIRQTIRHYKRFCRKIYVYDNYSDDSTPQIAMRMGCEVTQFGIPGQLNDREYINVKNNCWKGSDADWVIVCDADEILITVDFYESCSIIRTQGFNMFSNDIPRESWLEVNTGVKDDNYSKLVCFNPKALTEIGYVYGCHEAKPEGHVRYSSKIANLYHYKHVGGADRVADRHALYASRLSDFNRRWKCGHQYSEPREKTIKYFNDQLAISKPLF